MRSGQDSGSRDDGKSRALRTDSGDPIALLSGHQQVHRRGQTHR